MQPQPADQQPIVVGTQQPPAHLPPAANRRHNYAFKQALVLGVVQVVCGGLAIVFNIVGIVISSHAAHVGVGFWCGIMYIIAGALGIASAKSYSSGLVIGCMIMSIIAAVFTFAHLIYGAVAFSGEYIIEYAIFSHTTFSKPYYTSRRAMDILHVLIALVECGAAIWQSVLCCVTTCCAPSAGRPLQTVTVTQTTMPQGQQTVFVSPGQQPVTYVTTDQGYPQQYPQGQPMAQGGYPQGQPMAQGGYPQGQPMAQGGYPQGQPMAQGGYPQGQPMAQGGYPQGQAVAQGYPQGQQPVVQGYPGAQQQPQMAGGPPPYNPGYGQPVYQQTTEPAEKK